MAGLTLPPAADREQAFAAVADFLGTEGFTVVSADHGRPWGGFFVIDEAQSGQFTARFFPEAILPPGQRLSPKILVVAPRQRLSWQYHHRRAELWRVLVGPVHVMRSPTDDEGPAEERLIDELVELACGERHRLIGADQFGVVAEIWRHVDAVQPSDEADIVRLQDDFGRA